MTPNWFLKNSLNQALKFVYQPYFICDYIPFSKWIKNKFSKVGKYLISIENETTSEKQVKHLFIYPGNRQDELYGKSRNCIKRLEIFLDTWSSIMLINSLLCIKKHLVKGNVNWVSDSI